MSQNSNFKSSSFYFYKIKYKYKLGGVLWNKQLDILEKKKNQDCY